MRLDVSLYLLIVFAVIFAVPLNTSLLINDGVAYSNSSLVALSLNVTNASFCNYSNDGLDFSAGDFPPVLSKLWNLSSGEGLKTVFFKCTGEDNSTSDASDAIIVDYASPSFSTIVPASNSLATSANTEISVILTDSGSGINSSASVMKLNSSVVGAVYTSSSGKFSFSSALSESNYTVEVTAYDNAGYSNSTNWSFTVDFAPLISSLSPAENSVLFSASSLSAILTDGGSGINSSTIIISLDGSVLETNSSKFSFNNSTGVVGYSFNSLADGLHTISLSVKDNFGTATSKTWSFTVDSAGPSVLSVFPADKSTTINPSTCIYAIINDSGAGVNSSSLTLSLNNVRLLTRYDSTEYNLSFCPTVGISAGSYSVDFYGEDNLGNEKNHEWTFTIQSDAPSIEQLIPADKSLISTPRPQISAVLKAPSGSHIDNSTLKMFIDGIEVSPVFDSTSGKLSHQPMFDFSLGNHTIEVSVFTTNANKATKTWQFTYGYPVPAAPASFSINSTPGNNFLKWGAVTGVSYYHLYGSNLPFTSVGGISLLKNTSGTNYTHTVSQDRYYYAVVAVSSYGVPSLPVFVGSCASYSAGKWTNYSCCTDSHCANNSFCNLTVHACQTISAPSLKNVTRDEAKGAMDAAKTAIVAAKNKINVSLAELYMSKAENSYAMGDYSQAKTWAEGALLSLQSGPVISASNASLVTNEKKSNPFCGSSFIFLIVLFFIFVKGGVKYGKMF